MLFGNTFQSLYYEHLMEISAQHFDEDVRIAEWIEQVSRWKINGPTMDSRTMMRDE
jgi:hypothetical protein